METQTNKKLSAALTWEDLANAYNKKVRSGRRAMTLPMDAVFDWAERQEEFVVSQKGTIHRILTE